MNTLFDLGRPRRSVRSKLAAIVLTTALVVLIVTGAAMLFHDLSVSRKTWAGDVSSDANVLALTTAPALAFDDADAARRSLDALSARPAIQSAALYRVDGSRYAQYVRAGKASPPDRAPTLPAPEVSGSTLRLLQPVRFNEEDLGSLYVEARYDTLERVRAYLGIFSIIAVVSLAAALVLSAALQRALTVPLEEIGRVAQGIVHEGDYSLRVKRRTDDEIGLVVEALNRMLDEVQQRRAALEQTNASLRQREEALREADRRKDEFVATLAHELRNPLAPIRHATRILDSSSATPEQRQWCRDVIGRQVQHMALLLDDLLDVSRITRGRLELRVERVSLERLVGSAVETTRPLFEARHHRLELDLPATAIELDVDPLRISQALSNLLTNAAKYTDAGGRIRVVARREAEGLTLAVTDNGIGLQPGAATRVFEMFSQVESAIERSQGGLGIGLALVKGLVELHGGRVTASSEGAGKGSTFTLFLPESVLVTASGDSTPVRPTAPTGHGPRRSVLVVDDNRDAAESLALALSLEGHDVRVAHSAGDALALADQAAADVYVLDIGMPEMSGYALAERLRSGAAREALLIAVTGWGHEDDKRRARAAGFDLHFTKPADPHAIASAIAAYAPRS